MPEHVRVLRFEPGDRVYYLGEVCVVGDSHYGDKLGCVPVYNDTRGWMTARVTELRPAVTLRDRLMNALPADGFLKAYRACIAHGVDVYTESPL